MQRTCLKCWHIHPDATGAQMEACPKCGAIYTKVEQVMAQRQRQAQKGTPPGNTAPPSPSRAPARATSISAALAGPTAPQPKAVKVLRAATPEQGRLTFTQKYDKIEQSLTKKTGLGMGAWFLVALVVLPIAWLFLTQERTPTKPNPAAKCAKSDLSCLADRALIYAGGPCQREVERLAKYSVKWTDGAFESKFPRHVWRDSQSNTVTLIGDKVQFQNGFGAYSNMIYTCDVDMNGDKPVVLNAEATAGHLP